jgi:alpha-tubulin suppressor-like RCC1 family protein
MRRSLIASRSRLECVVLVAAVGVFALVCVGGAGAAGRPSNSALGWGLNADGELGDGTSTGPGRCIEGYPCGTSPITVRLPKGTRVTTVAAGYDSSLALTATGRVLAWGSNRFGQGTFTGPGTCAVFGVCSTTPIIVKLPKGTRVTAVAAGYAHSLALASTGQVLAWGSNEDGELGNGTFARLGGCACSTTPVKVKLPKRAKATAVAAGSVYSLAIVHPA